MARNAVPLASAPLAPLAPLFRRHLPARLRFREWEAVNRSNRQRIYSMSANVIEVDAGFDGSLPKPMDAKRLRGLLQKRGSSKVHPV